MASRAAPQQGGSMAVAGGMGKNQKPPAGDVNKKNRKVLGDIGNTVNTRAAAELKALPQVSRPVTRSFRAHLLRNAQLAAEVAVKKSTKPEPVVEEDGAIEAAKAKAAVDKTDVEVVTIRSSSKTTRSRKKATSSLTSVLTARSKAACGTPTAKPKAAIRDIDGLDANDQLAIVEYVEDLYTFYKLAEGGRPKNDYMESQVEINAKMRSILVDWLVEVHHKFDLMPETLYLTLYIMDKYLSMAMVRRRELQLVGISAMLIACKYEEIWAPEVNDFICICDRAYCREQILAMEKVILGKLEWCVTVPTPYVFLLRFLKAAAMSNKDTKHMSFFLAELGMMNYSTLAYSPSMVAASAVYAARRTLKQEPHWDETLERHTGFEDSELRECVKLLVCLHSKAADSNLKVVFNKYSGSQFGAVALKSPAAADDVSPSSEGGL